ncbi:M48 family metallopeptidase [Candidatus Saccharibacteria bacterium]|nr:M48 family metallopeptidase [Candidatus Saccharibacteria bacterium]
MPELYRDDEFGEITLRHTTGSSIRVKLSPDGTFKASLPYYCGVPAFRRALNSMREQLRETYLQHKTSTGNYSDGDKIGFRHHIHIRTTSISAININTEGSVITVNLPQKITSDNEVVQQLIRPHIVKALKKEAKIYLPKRLALLAENHGFYYERVRFSHTSSRWGSCSTKGTISLNIALMKLPLEIIDYVLIHELCHTVHMNHSSEFWKAVQLVCNDYKLLRQKLKNYSPYI